MRGLYYEVSRLNINNILEKRSIRSLYEVYIEYMRGGLEKGRFII
jgi:hypothetical protein